MKKADFAFAPYEERVVWSPEHGGCLMIQRRYTDPGTSVARAVGPGWHDWTSGCEGEYPTLDAAAQRAVARANDNLKLIEER